MKPLTGMKRLSSLLAGILVVLLIASCVRAQQLLRGSARTPSTAVTATPSANPGDATPAILPIAGMAAVPTGGAEAGAPSAPSSPGNSSSMSAATSNGSNPGGDGPLAPTAASVSGVQYVSPKPGSVYNPAGTTIAVRYGDSLDQMSLHAPFDVSGSASGKHQGSVLLSDDQATLIFKPDKPFTAGETVKANVGSWSAASGNTHPSVAFSFVVAPQEDEPASTIGQIVPQDSATPQLGAGAGGPTGKYVTLPADFPTISVTVPANGVAPGLVFVSNFQLEPGPSGYYLLILDNSGDPVYYQKLAANSRSLDFKALPDGTLSYADDARDAFVLLDSSYREIGTVTPGNGFHWSDEHDLQLLPNGHYLIMANEVRTMDLSRVVPGGNAKASVTAQVIQELDRNRNVVFQWRLLDYIPIGDTSQPLNASAIDFSHTNALALDNDGNLLVSSRHLDEITKVDRQTGAILWRLGGKANQYRIAAAAGVSGPAEFYHQHDVRVLPNGHITVFDNHNDHQPQVSRALEYVLDQAAKTATLIWEWQTSPAPYALAMGNVQRLSNGNTFIGWGTNLFPNLDEVKPDGTKAFELDFGGTDVTYRAFRFPWQGHPAWPPALVAQIDSNSLKLTFSWNGATEVSSYRVLGGNTSPPSMLVAEPKKSGFETSYVVPDFQSGFCYYQIIPVDNQGQAMQPSAVVTNLRAQSCPGSH